MELEMARKHFYFKSALVLAISLVLSGCAVSSNSNQDSSAGIGSKDVWLLDSTLEFECADKNDYYYNVYFGISFKNNSNQTITKEDINVLKIEATLRNVNGLGRLDTTDFLLSQDDVKPGENGFLAFALSLSPDIKWESLEISINESKVYDQPVSISESICP